VKLTIHPLALRESQEAADWYEQRRTGLGEAFSRCVTKALHQIEVLPLAWPRWSEDPTIHLEIVRRFPYTIAFRVEIDSTGRGAKSVRVLAVAHDKRRRGYWADR
jgi:toxin ParE1/3/4